MKRKVRLSNKTKIRLDSLFNYLESEWSLKVKNDFIKKFDKSIKQISFLPYSCPESIEFKGLFKCVVTKQTIIYYRIKEDIIEVITLVDSRQDPKKTEKELK